MIESVTFSYKITLSSKSILKQLGNEPFTKKGNLPLTIVFFWKFFLGMRTSYK